MKLFGLFVMLMAALALFVGAGQAAPEPKGPSWGTIKKGGEFIKKGFGVISAAGTAHEVYSHVKNRGN